MSFLGELKRRNVLKVGAAYLVWLGIRTFRSTGLLQIEGAWLSEEPDLFADRPIKR